MNQLDVDDWHGRLTFAFCRAVRAA